MTLETMVLSRARLDHGRSAGAAPEIENAELAPRVLVPLLAALAVALFAAAGPADARAEGLFLARMMAGVLAACSVLAPRLRLAGGAAALVVAAAWVLPAGPPRAVAVTGLLLAALAASALTSWSDRRGAEVGELAFTLPLFLGAQFLLRSELLLSTPDARALVALLVLPAASAAAISVLALRQGPRALIAAAAVLCLAPGSNVATTLALVALAAGSSLVEVHGRLWQTSLAVVGLAAPLFWNWRAGLVAALAGVVLAATTAKRNVAFTVAGSAVATAVACAVLAGRATSFEALALMALLVPSVLLCALTPQPAALAAGAFAIATLAGVDGPVSAIALAAPVALASLAPLASSLGQAREQLTVRWQLAWSSALLVLTTGFATYPWLRGDALQGALGALGLSAATLADVRVWVPALILLVALLAIDRHRWRRALPILATAGVAIAIVLHLGGPVRALLPNEVVLTAEHPQWQADLGGAAPEVRTLTVESTLLNAAQLSRGARAGEIVVVLSDGSERRFAVRVGEETGEWAARRDDLRAANLAPAPLAWLSWVSSTPGSGAPFFGQRYRTRWTLPNALPVRTVTALRDSGLPPQSALVVYAIGGQP